MSLVNSLLSNKVEKFTIEAYETNEYNKTAATKSLVLPYNPESVNMSYLSKFSIKKSLAAANYQSKEDNIEYDGQEPISLSLTLTLDATLPDNVSVDILKTVTTLEEFGYATKHNATQPPYLNIIWGSTHWIAGRSMFQCRMTSMNVTYTLFDNDGKPLRATISLSFIGNQTYNHLYTTRNGSSGFRLPDINLPVTPFTTLSTLVAYGGESNVDYVSAAIGNSLDSFHDLIPGITLRQFSNNI